MRALAIEDHQWLFYDGTHAKLGHGIWPAPSVSSATIIRAGDAIAGTLPQNDFINEMKMVFREDSFDPVTRVRRVCLELHRCNGKGAVREREAGQPPARGPRGPA